MITVFDSLYGTTYTNIVDMSIKSVPVYGVHRYRIDFRFSGGKKDILWLDEGPTRRDCYIQLGDEQYKYNEIKKNEKKFILKLNNELTKTALEVLE